MNFAVQKKSTWAKQAAVVVSDSPNVHMLLRELLRSYGWTVAEATPRVERAVALVKQGLACLVIADDTLATPCLRHVRYLLSDPIAVCTPILAFLLEAHKNEAPALSKMGRPQLVDKPLTPSKFVPAFTQLVHIWEREPYLTLRRANYEFLAGNDSRGVRTLARLASVEALQHLCAQAVALHLRRLGKIKEAETVLLGSLKRSPRELGTMFALVDLYLHAAMPNMAHQLLLSARGAFGQSIAVIPDLVQTEILMGRLSDAVQSLSILHKAGYAEEETAIFLARLLITEGREQEAERIMNGNKNVFKQIIATWLRTESSSSPSLNAAG